MLLTEGLLVGVFALACCGLVFILRAFLCACAWLSFFGVVVCFYCEPFGLSCFCGEFDPGSGRTLAACLTHASRTMRSVLALVD